MSLHQLSDEALVTQFASLIAFEQEQLVRQLEHIAELDRRKLFFHHESLWAYLVHAHGMEESTAERRIRAARLLRTLPEVKRDLEVGLLNLSLLDLAQGCARREGLSDTDLCDLVKSLKGMSCRVARREITTRYPARELPHDRVRPLTEDLAEVRFVASQELLAQLDEIRGLLAHSHPGASIAEVIGVIADDYRERHHPEARAARAKSSPSTSKVHARAPTRDIVHSLVKRDGYVCAYIDSTTDEGCGSTYGLQIDHIQSWSKGGETRLDNLRYLCANHHRRVSFVEFDAAVARAPGSRA